jgi:hypothetical protein
VLFHGVSEPVCPLVVLEEVDAMFETPVVGKTSDSSMLVKVRPLTVVRVQFVSVSFGHQHEIQSIVLIGRYKPIQSLVITLGDYLIYVKDCLGFFQLPLTFRQSGSTGFPYFAAIAHIATTF